jgi:hypothetical protein
VGKFVQDSIDRDAAYPSHQRGRGSSSSALPVVGIAWEGEALSLHRGFMDSLCSPQGCADKRHGALAGGVLEATPGVWFDDHLEHIGIDLQIIRSETRDLAKRAPVSISKPMFQRRSSSCARQPA